MTQDTRTLINQWLADLSGGNDFELDADGQCGFEQDGIDFTLEVPPEGSICFLKSEVLHLPENTPAHFLQKALSINMTLLIFGQIGMALNPEEHQLMLVQRFHLHEGMKEIFVTQIPRFSLATRHCKQLLEALLSRSDAAAADPQTQKFHPEFNDPTFIFTARA